MSIQKKSLISTLKTAKKANVASDTKGEKIGSMKLSAKHLASAKGLKAKAAVSSLRSFKLASAKSSFKAMQ